MLDAHTDRLIVCYADIRDLISVEDVMEELGYGPNGGLVYCMECVVLLASSAALIV